MANIKNKLKDHLVNDFGVENDNGVLKFPIDSADDARITALEDSSLDPADKTKIDYISVTQAVDLDTMESDISTKEDALGNPDTDGKVLSSLADGTRSWVDSSGYDDTALQSQVTQNSTDITTKEDVLGNPDVNGKVLSSSTDGTRTWVELNTYDDTTLQAQANQNSSDILTKEDALGNPDVDGKVLSSLADGTRTWVELVASGGGSDADVDWMLSTDVFAPPVIAYQPIAAEVNSTGSVNPIVVSGTLPFTSYAITSGTLPAGFSFDTTTGVVSWTTDGTSAAAVNVGISATNPVGVGHEYVVAMSIEAPNGRAQYTNDENLYAGVRISTSNSTRSQVFIKQAFHGTTTSTSNGTMIEDAAYPIWAADNGDETWNYFMQPGGYSYWNIFLNSTTDPADLANGFVSDITTGNLTYDLVAPNSQDAIHDGVRYPSDATDIHYFTSRYYLRVGTDVTLDGFGADAGGSWSFGFRLQRAWLPDGLGRPMFAREGRNWQGVKIGHSSTYSEMIFGNGSSQTYDSTEVATLPGGGFAAGSFVKCTYDDSSNIFSFYVDGTKYYDYGISPYLDAAPGANSLDVVFGKSVDSDDLTNTNNSYDLSYWQGEFDRLWIANGVVETGNDDGTTYPTGVTHAWDMTELTGKTFTPSIGSVTMTGDRTTF